MLILLWPIAALVVLAWAVRPDPEGTVTAPLRLAAVRAALLLGAAGVVGIEALSAFGALGRTSILVLWGVLTLAVAGAAWYRHRTDPRPLASRTWRRTLATATAATTGQWTVGALIAILGGSVLLLVLTGQPNNFDSQTYHLPRIEHWIQNGDVDAYPTRIHRQVDISPGAEYLLTHLRLVTGGDQAYAGLQFLAAIGCLTAASRITAQLGGGMVAQIATVFLLSTTPEVLLQATSTQVDLVAAAWVACLATLVLDPPRRRPDGTAAESALTVLFLGLALGLIAVTKSSGLAAAAPLLVWWGLARLKRDGEPGPPCPCDHGDEECGRPKRKAPAYARTVGASALILVLGFLVVGPFLGRMQTTFGNPLGPPALTESVGTTTADPRLLSVNLLKIAHTAYQAPFPPLTDAGTRAVEAYAGLLGADVDDPAITFGDTEFPTVSWYPDEDKAAFPLLGIAALAGFLYCLRRPPDGLPRPDASRRVYAVVVALAVVGFCATVAWQPWINRLLLFLVVLAAPLGGLAAAAFIERTKAIRSRSMGRSVASWTLIAVFAGLASLAGVLTTTYGFPHRIAGTGSVFATTEAEQRFLRRAAWRELYEDASDEVAARLNTDGGGDVGLVQGNDSWEYPWWYLLRERLDHPGDLMIHPLQSKIDGTPVTVAAKDMDAIVCAEAMKECEDYVPDDWELHRSGIVAYALPSDAPPR